MNPFNEEDIRKAAENEDGSYDPIKLAQTLYKTMTGQDISKEEASNIVEKAKNLTMDMVKNAMNPMNADKNNKKD